MDDEKDGFNETKKKKKKLAKNSESEYFKSECSCVLIIIALG